MRYLAVMIRSEEPEFFILGRVRMRVGFHWRPALPTSNARPGPVAQGNPNTVPPICRMGVQGGHWALIRPALV